MMEETKVDLKTARQTRRNLWIMTGFGTAALALLGMFAYAVSNYAVR